MCFELLDKQINQGQILPKGVCSKWINGYFCQPIDQTSIRYPFCVIHPLDKWINGYFDQCSGDLARGYLMCVLNGWING